MAVYSVLEKIDMILIYGEAGRNSVQACQLYAQRYPDRIHPSRRCFNRTVHLFCETGSVKSRNKERRKTTTGVDSEITVLAAVVNNPQISCRQIERYSGIAKTCAWRILKRHKFHPFHMSLHQELHGNDFQNRVHFCEWALHKLQSNEHFFNNVLFTDESTFTNHGQLNTHNMHYWSVENPKWLRQVVHQRPWNVNVWCGVLEDRIIGPFFIEGNLNGQKYADFLTQKLPGLLEDVSLAERLRMWYQHDGCPAHSALIARRVLNRKLPRRWIGRGSNICWPARSPDLTPLDFFLWGAIKETVYNDVPTTPENMKERIRRACADISQETIRSARRSFIYRLQKCIEVGGHHFEHLLK